MSSRAVVIDPANPDWLDAPVTLKAYLMCGFSAFSGIFFGYDSGYINGVMGMPYFIKHIEGPDATSLSGPSKGLITSILSLGTFIGRYFPSPSFLFSVKYEALMSFHRGARCW